MPDVIARNLPYLAGGLATTLAMAALTALFGTALAIPVALLRHARTPLLATLCAAYVAIIRGTPILVVLLLFAFAFPALFTYRTTPETACVIGFSVFLAAYCAEDMRAGLLAVPDGIREAGTALGLTPAQTLRLIVLPLAARVAAPALAGQYVRMVKYTSVAAVLGVPELTGRALLVNARAFQPWAILGGVALAYLAICLSLSLLARWLQTRLAW